MQEQAVQWLVSPEELAAIPIGKRAVGYVRVSDEGGRGEDLISPEIQQHSMETLAEKEGLTIVAWIFDIDQSGRSFTKRRVQRAAQGVRDGEWKVVLLWKWSRWGRNMKESLIYLSLVEDDANGIVRAATEDFDPKTSVGKFSRNQMLLIAELQSDMISDGWKETQAKRRRDGLPHTGGQRWGYTYARRTGHVPHPTQAPILREAYERYVAGASHRGLALEWNAKGLRTLTGGLWGPTSLARMMDTGFAAGLIRERSTPRDNGSKTLSAFDIWRQGAHEPIIDRELWELYKKRREEQAAMPARVRVAVHTLSGVMVCGWEGCTGHMTVYYSMRRGARWVNWGCTKARFQRAHSSNSISDKRAMEGLLEWISKEAEGTEANVDERARRMEAGKTAAVDAETFDAEIRRLTAKRGRLANAYTDGDIERPDYLAQKAEIEAALRAAQEAKDEALARQDAAGAYTARQFAALRDEWDRFTPAGRREALLALVSKVVVMPGDRLAVGRIVPVPRWRKPD